jgi:hypothetical protein
MPAGMFDLHFTINFGDWASWVQAVGSIGAILAAAVLWWFDQRSVRRKDAEREKEFLRRLVAALRAELAMAVETAQINYESCALTLKAWEARAALGLPLDRSPFPPRAFAFTDATVYRSMASQLGRLRADLVSEVVKFYSLAAQSETNAQMGTTEGGTRVVYDHAPRLATTGELLNRKLDRFEKADFSLTVDLKPSRDEIIQTARRFHYDIERIARERGVDIAAAQ